jgi:phosphatidylglycerophosphatase A
MIRKINLLFVTFFYTGYIKIASGTFASLFTSIILFYLFRSYISIDYFHIISIATFFIFIYSLFAIKTLKNEFEEIDASEIVIDEVVGQIIPIIIIEYINCSQSYMFGANLSLYVISFFLFRFFDIFKPFFIRYFDKNYKNSFGIMFDDVLAGIYTSIVIFLFLELYKFF